MNATIKAGITLLEVLFVAGIVGSAIVVLLTGFEDVKTMFSRKDEKL